MHRYAAPGSYNVSVLVFEGSLSASQFLPITITPATLSVVISLSTASGVAPVLETFSATITGGSGTYPAVRWNFGDGGSGSGLLIRYTYDKPGNYLVTVNVTDSLGHSAASQVWLNVTGGGTTSSLGQWWPILAVAVAALGGTSVGALLVGAWLGRRRAPEPLARPGPEPVESEVEAVPATRAPAPAVREPVPAPPTAPAAPEREPSPPAPAAEPSVPAGEPAPEVLRVSQRIVLHLAGLGSLGPDEVASVGFTQLGMSQALGTRQNALTNVLRRLVAAGVLSEDVRHVRGQPRRLKVYRLTSRGEALARELRHPRGTTRPPG